MTSHAVAHNEEFSVDSAQISAEILIGRPDLAYYRLTYGGQFTIINVFIHLIRY